MGKEKANLPHFGHPVSLEGVCMCVGMWGGGCTDEQLWSSQSKDIDSLKNL